MQAKAVQWMKKYLEASQAAAVVLATSATPGKEAARRRRSTCRGDGSLWESRTQCRCTCRREVAGCLHQGHR